MTGNLQQSLDKLGDTYERVHNNIIALKTTVSQQSARIKELEAALEFYNGDGLDGEEWLKRMLNDFGEVAETTLKQRADV